MVIINTGTICDNDNSINISGDVFGSNITITTANAIVKCKSRILNHFDEKLSFDASSIEKIVIDSDININMSVSNSSKVTVHFCGQAEIAKEDIWFDARIDGHELIIKLKFIDDCYNSNLKLDVIVPYKTFKAIWVDTTSADFTLNKGVSMESLRVSSTSGKIRLQIYATKDIEVGISSMYGNVSVEFENVNFSYLSTRSLRGKIVNYYKSGNGYTAKANVDISTTSGNITLY